LCGIFGYTGNQTAAPLLVDGLKLLEYRGYDSAGIAVMNGSRQISLTRRAGGTDSVARLAAAIDELHLSGTTGIAHTRWATHGEVAERNSHPHASQSGTVAIVHNGIVENYLHLKAELKQAGFQFKSETDSEVIAHLIAREIDNGCDLTEAVRRTTKRVEGAAAIVATSVSEPDKLVAARLGNAGGIVIGPANGSYLVASDIVALLPHTNRVCYLESGQVAAITPSEFHLTTLDGQSVTPEFITSSRNVDMAAKGRYQHFMAKEIAEQPDSVTGAIRQRVDLAAGKIALPEFTLTPKDVQSIDRAVFFGMGTSMHAAMSGASALETLARIPSHTENASEFRYRNPVLNERTLVVSVTQSGETADTLAATELARDSGSRLVTVVEAEGTQATRLAEVTLPVRCGHEIGVAATKTITATMVTLALMAARIASLRRQLSTEDEASLAKALSGLPALVGTTLERDQKVRKLADDLAGYKHLLYLGRGAQFPIALEGALKMKEIAYIHAEGYAAGEMKHGVNALISKDMPTIALAPHDAMFEKMISNVNEVKSRGGRVIAVTTDGDDVMASLTDDVLYVPRTHPLFQPVLNLIPMQLLAYHTSIALGLDPDKPRHLAKTVTVE
jgi:glucosamine--fructose-6-phosphate aminotransferase (isomerizing)